ncbi:hypothetical protein B601_1037 [Chlamydia psittaci WS/RT/E30]|nr:hypothetical protein B601_1037 [Chlamydia psittaci WS/RT/E30]
MRVSTLNVAFSLNAKVTDETVVWYCLRLSKTILIPKGINIAATHANHKR